VSQGRPLRPAWVEVDLAAVEANAALLVRLCAPARLCAVVKADAYGHGAVEVARAALRGGASQLAVALVEEGMALRDAGIVCDILLLSEPTDQAMIEAARYRITPTLYRPEGVARARRAARASATGASATGASATGVPAAFTVELKVDTGMHRVGVDPVGLLDLAQIVDAARELHLGGLWTHFAVADDPYDSYTDIQLKRFFEACSTLRDAGIAPGQLHVANSAAAISRADARLDLVRCGIALYGYDPSTALVGMIDQQLPGCGLRRALSWKADMHMVRRLEAGERTSYGRLYEIAQPGYVGVIPLGYRDGVSRRYSTNGGEVLVNGVRRRIAGAVTMDQTVIDLGDDPTVRPGDEVVLIGRQGDDEITVEEWADRLGTITYEVLCGIGSRVPRLYVEGPE